MVFPGHGAEQPRMGLALAEQFEPARALLDHAGALAGVDARAVLRRGGDRLSDTRVLQPLMVAVELGLVAALAERALVPSYALGYSLGELAAWSALGGVSAFTAIALAALRGRLLGELARAQPGAMLMLPELDEAELDAALAHGRSAGVVDRGIEAAPRRVVLTGDRLALARVAERFGGSFVPTTGAWHSRLMSPAQPEFEAGLRAIEPEIRATPTLITNAEGTLLGDAAIVPRLAAQIDRPVRFAAGMATLARVLPADAALLVIGPAKPLRSLIAANWPTHPPLHVVEAPADLDRLHTDLGAP